MAPAALNVYFKKTRSHFFGLLSVLFLLLIYEGSNTALYENQQIQVRNSAEVMIKRTLWFVGLRENWLLWAAYLLLLGWAFWLAKEQQVLDFKFVYFPYVVFESTLYGLVFGLVAGQLTERTSLAALLQGDSAAANVGAKMVLALGAGIYEELLFRFVLTSLLLLIFKQLVGDKNSVYIVLAVIISALLFSGFHYLGGREIFTLDSFLLRFYGGVILGALFVIRGLGVAAYTHTMYDLLLIFR
jgi:hypothetical protein